MAVFFIWQDFILLVFGIWLIAVSVVLYRIFALFNKLTKGVEAADLKKILEKVITQEAKNEKDINDLLKRVNYQEEASRSYVQKVGLIRFNPFKELGGDHSFSLAILDKENNGIVITSLHTRDRTRVYMKKIQSGKGDIELSDEEKKAIAKAK